MTEVGRNFEDIHLDGSDISSCRYVIVCDNSCFGFDDCNDDDRKGVGISSSKSKTTNCNKPAQRQLWQYFCYSCLSTGEVTDDDHIDFGACCSHHKKKELRNKVHLSSTLTTDTSSTSSSGERGPPHNGTVILFYQIKEQLYDLHDEERNDFSHQQDIRGDFQQNDRFFPSIQDKMVKIRQQLDDKRNTLNDVLSRDYRCTAQEDESIATVPSKPPPIKDKKRIHYPQLKYKNHNTNKKERNKEGKSNPPFLPKSPSFKKKTKTHRPLQIETKKKEQLKNIISSTVSINSKKRENDQDIKNRIERRNQRHYVTKQYIISKDETTSHGSDFGIKKSKKNYEEIVRNGVALKYPNHLYELTSSDKLRNSSLASSSTDIHFSSTISTSETSSSSSSSSYSSYKSSPIIAFRGDGENDIFNRLYKLSKNQQKAGQEKRAKIERALRIKNQDHFNGIHGSNVFENKKISRKEAEKLYLRGIKHLLELDRRRSERAKQQMNQDNYQPFLFRESLKEKVLSSDIED